MSADTFKIQLREIGKATNQEKVVFVLFIVLAVLWIIRAEISSDSLTFKGWASLFNVPDFINDGTTAVFISLLLFIVIPATIASSLVFMLPTATPPNAIIFGTGAFQSTA